MDFLDAVMWDFLAPSNSLEGTNSLPTTEHRLGKVIAGMQRGKLMPTAYLKVVLNEWLRLNDDICLI